ncbi:MULTISPECIES: hypothetical protein [Myxococcaceae]|nr:MULTISPECIES: hypothetical protein [Myxococcaceae]
MPQMMEQAKKAQHDVSGLALGALMSTHVFTLVLLCLDYMGR